MVAQLVVAEVGGREPLVAARVRYRGHTWSRPRSLPRSFPGNLVVDQVVDQFAPGSFSNRDFGVPGVVFGIVGQNVFVMTFINDHSGGIFDIDFRARFSAGSGLGFRVFLFWARVPVSGPLGQCFESDVS